MYDNNRKTNVRIVCLLLIFNILHPINSEAYEIWQPYALKEMFTNNTKIISEFLKTQTNVVGDAINGYVDDAKKQTQELKKDVESFIEDKSNQFNNNVHQYINTAKNGMNIFTEKGDCNYDPDVEFTTPQIIARHGYSAESHTVQTEDGYLLTLHRIPRAKGAPSNMVGRQAVFLQHGLLASSADWIMNGPEKALAYILANAGYDVWMGNVRGNSYSRAHISLSASDAAFWNFTWHEAAIYDLPASIDYINSLKNTDNEMIYIGHSMGTTMMFVLLSTRPEYNTKLKAGFALAPVAYMSNIKSPIRLLAPYANNIAWIVKLLGAGEFLPQNTILKWLARFGCEINNYEEKICENSIFILCGFDEKQFNKTLLPMILSHTPAGASTKSLIHYAQEIKAKGRFQYFDYGDEDNVKQYGQKSPPQYPLNTITLPIALFTGDNDWLSAVSDSRNIFKQLINPIEMYEVPMKEFNHLDFLWGIDAPTLVYDKLFELMDKYKLHDSLSLDFKQLGLKVSWNNNLL